MASMATSTMANDKKPANSKKAVQREDRRVKKARLWKKSRDAKAIGTDHFSRLPLELVAAILCLTTTKDVLAVARSSRHLCQILVDFPSCNFIWRQARLNLSNLLPDPLPNLTESAYAALLFDPGVCEQCGTVIRKPFTSFALRLRICEEGNCMRDWAEQKGVRVSTLARLSRPYVDWIVASRCRIGSGYPFVAFELVCRKSDYTKLERDFRDAKAKGANTAEYAKAHTFERHKRDMILLHSQNVQLWVEDWLKQGYSVARANAKHTRQFAIDNSWNFWDLLSTPTYRKFYECKKRSAEEISRKEIDVLQEVMQTEMERLIRKREGRNEHEEREGRIRQVKKTYARLRSSNPRLAFPTLPVFQGLGVISVILNNRKKSAAAAKEDMGSSAFQSLLEDNLSVWRENQQRVLMKLICGPDRNGKLHCLDFPSARFNCKRCKDQASNHFKPVSLSFSDVCKHECVGMSKDTSRAWSITQFVLDKKAFQITNKLLELLGLKDEDSNAQGALTRMQVLCDSCDGMVVINSLNGLHEHCQRHDDMKISVYSGYISPSLELGLRDELLSRKRSGERERKRKSFCCRHCLPGRANSDPSIEVQKTIPDGYKVKNKAHFLFDFDGVRSHLKSRHGVKYLADEDFFRVDTRYKETILY